MHLTLTCIQMHQSAFWLCAGAAPLCSNWSFLQQQAALGFDVVQLLTLRTSQGWITDDDNAVYTFREALFKFSQHSLRDWKWKWVMQLLFHVHMCRMLKNGSSSASLPHFFFFCHVATDFHLNPGNYSERQISESALELISLQIKSPISENQTQYFKYLLLLVYM